MANTVKLLPTLSVTTAPVRLSVAPASGAAHHWGLSVSVQNDPASAGKLFVGDATVSTTKYSRVLNAGDYYTVAGSAVDPSTIWVVSDSTATAHPSWN